LILILCIFSSFYDSETGLFGLRLDKRRLEGPSKWNGLDTHLELQYEMQKKKNEKLLMGCSGKSHQMEAFSFDFFADTGDGFDSTYAIARALAQPLLGDSPRSKLVIFGGDLVYPSPSKEDYIKRVIFPFHSAFPPPDRYSLKQLGSCRSSHSEDNEPEMLLLPGNHDWIDGLVLFQEEILDNPTNHFAGWRLTQKSSYFANRLPGNWVIFGLDSALELDIDMIQFQRFCEVAASLTSSDRVIILTHQPLFWVSSACGDPDWPHAPTYSRTLTLLRLLGGKCRLLLSGDIHNYIRYVPVSSPFLSSSSSSSSSTSSSVHPLPMLVTCGGGGAFLHPTHLSLPKMIWKGEEYHLAKTFPSPDVSRWLTFHNIGNFRSKNLPFDIIGVFLYFSLIFSAFPSCFHPSLNQVVTDQLADCTSIAAFLSSIFFIMVETERVILTEGVFSLVAFLILLVTTIAILPKSSMSFLQRISLGFLHALAHQLTAVLIFSSLTLVSHSSLPFPQRSSILEEFPSLVIAVSAVDGFTFGYATPTFMSIVDFFDLHAFLSSQVHNSCAHPTEIFRFNLIIMYLIFGLFFAASAAPLVSLNVGMYLFFSDRVCGIHWDESFSALSCPNYKSFLRFQLQEDNSLKCNVFGIERVPCSWVRDHHYDQERENHPNQPSYNFHYPSKWISDDPKGTEPKVVDSFIIC
jgi:hypothetical protein